MSNIKHPVRASPDGPRVVFDAEDNIVLKMNFGYYNDRDEVIAAMNSRAKVIAYISDVRNGVSSKAFNDLMRILGELHD